jgi:CelD/BcsL family acetyltransferase involved in cellulose biosynthesis
MNLTHVEELAPARTPPVAPARQGLEHRVWGHFGQTEPIRQAWNDLALRTGDILASYDWCRTWWKYFGAGRQLQIHTLHDGGRLVAVLPLFRETIRPGGLWLRTVRVVGCDYTGGTVGLALEPAFAEAFVSLVLRHLDHEGTWDILQIGALRSYNTVAEPIAQAFARHPGVGHVIVGRQDNWCTLFPLPDSYDAFLASLPGKSRTEISRRERQFREAHKVEVDVVTDPQKVQSVLDTLIALHQKRWTGRGQPGRFGDVGAVEPFHRELAQQLAGQGQLMLLVMKADDNIVSVTYGYDFGSRTLALFGSHSYDPQWQRFGIGRIMYTHLIRHAIGRGSTVIDDGRGVFEHKISLGGQLHGERSLVVVRRGLSTHLRFWAALRTAYGIHVLYSRVWTDMVAPRLGWVARGTHFHVRYGALAQIFRRVRFPLLAGPRVLEARCPEPEPEVATGGAARSAKGSSTGSTTEHGPGPGPDSTVHGTLAPNQLLSVDNYCVYHSFEEVAPLKGEWNDLAERAGDILCSFDWCELWWKHFSRWRRLEIHTLRESGRLVAVLPLFRETIHPGGIPLRVVWVVGCDYTVHTVGLAMEPEHASRFMQMVLDRLGRDGRWDIFQITALRSYAAACEPLSQACAEHPDVQTVVIGRRDTWCTILPLPGTYEAFLASLSGNARNDTRRRERRLREHHQVEVDTVTDPALLEAAMDALIRLHQAYWTHKGHPGQLREPPVQQFHRELARRLVQTGNLVLLLLKVDGQIRAATYGYRFGKRTHGLFRGMCDDAEWREYSLGRIIHCNLIHNAITHGSSALEDGHGVFEYKLRLGGQLHGGRSLMALHRGWTTRLRFWVALRAAYGVHLVYSRIWGDMIRPRLGLAAKARHFHQRNWVLAQLYKRLRFGLFGGPRVLETICLQAAPLEHLANAADREAVRRMAADQSKRAAEE